MRRILSGIIFLLPTAAFAAEMPKDAPPPMAATFNIQAEIQRNCGGAPLGLVDLNGSTASKQVMDEARFQVTKFIAESDAYQDCVLRASAAVIKKLTRNDKITIVKIIYASQAEKEAVGKAFNQSVDAYNAAHGIALTPDPALPSATPPKPAKPAVAPAKPAAVAPPKPAGTKPAATKPAAPAKPATPPATPAAPPPPAQ